MLSGATLRMKASSKGMSYFLNNQIINIKFYEHLLMVVANY